MNLETFQLPVIAGLLFVIGFLIVLPLLVMSGDREFVLESTRDQDPFGGSTCDLPPSLETRVNEAHDPDVGPPPIDKSVSVNSKTATFAMG